MAAFNREVKASPYAALPKVTFTDSVTFHMNGETVNVFYVKNAHTDGDVIIHFKESNIFHTGDVFVRYGFPFIDQGAGGSIDGMIKATDLLIARTNDQSKIIPGHGALSAFLSFLSSAYPFAGRRSWYRLARGHLSRFRAAPSRSSERPPTWCCNGA